MGRAHGPHDSSVLVSELPTKHVGRAYARQMQRLSGASSDAGVARSDHHRPALKLHRQGVALAEATQQGAVRLPHLIDASDQETVDL